MNRQRPSEERSNMRVKDPVVDYVVDPIKFRGSRISDDGNAPINLIQRLSLKNAEGGNYTEEEEADPLPHPRMEIYIDYTGKLQLELLKSVELGWDHRAELHPLYWCVFGDVIPSIWRNRQCLSGPGYDEGMIIRAWSAPVR